MPCAVRVAERLGVDELGPYAFEPCMPARVRARLRVDGERNVVQGVIPKLEDLLSDNPAVEAARLCRSDTSLVHKLAREGETFCGYRNLQMLLHSIDTQSQWHTIFDIQDKIEKAWDAGHNAEGREQTGGIKNTRKFVGTPEVEALLQAQGVQCQGSRLEGEHAARALCTLVAAYYGLSTGPGVQLTERYPMFLQKPGHSVLIIGAAKLRDDSMALLVFDPSRPPHLFFRRQWKSNALRRVFGKSALSGHMITELSLARDEAFEVLAIDQPAPA